MPTERVCSNCDIPLDADSSYCSKCGGKSVEKGKTKNPYNADIPMDNIFKDKKSIYDTNSPKNYLFKDKISGDKVFTKYKIFKFLIAFLIFGVLILSFMQPTQTPKKDQTYEYRYCVEVKMRFGAGAVDAMALCNYNYPNHR